MAFDDFEPADADPTAQQGQDDDLFDFPLVDPFGVAQAQGSSPAPAAAEPVANTPVAALAADDDLFAAPESGASLDSFEADVDRLSERVADLIEDDDLDAYLDEPLIDDDFETVTEEPVTAPAPKAKPKRARAQAPVEVELPAAAPVATHTASAHAAPAAQAGSFKLGRPGMLIAGLAGVFAFALLGVVWSAGRGMQAALASRSEVANEVQLQTRLAELELLMNSQREELLSALQAKDDELTENLPTNVRVEPEWFVERKLIQEAMNEGRYREARKRLFALQAVMDELSEDVSKELAPAVAFLIPETYRLQAEHEGGEQ
jgi:hypothetical protein